MLHRRAFLAGLIAAPFVVKASSLMPIKAQEKITLNGIELTFDGGFNPALLDLFEKRMDDAHRIMAENIAQQLYEGGDPIFTFEQLTS